MKKGKGIIKKVLATVAVTTMTVSLAAAAVDVAGLTEFVVKRYTGISLSSSHDFKDNTNLKGYYQVEDSSHKSRARTDCRSGAFLTRAYTELYYYNSNHNVVRYGVTNPRYGQNTWINTEWVELKNVTYISAAKIKFCGEVYGADGNPSYIDVVTVN